MVSSRSCLIIIITIIIIIIIIIIIHSQYFPDSDWLKAHA